jgi:hypothetical protein
LWADKFEEEKEMTETRMFGMLSTAYDCALAMAAIVRGVRQPAAEPSRSGDSGGNDRA